MCFNMKWYKSIHDILILKDSFFCLYLIDFSCLYLYCILESNILIYMKRKIVCVNVSE